MRRVCPCGPTVGDGRRGQRRCPAPGYTVAFCLAPALLFLCFFDFMCNVVVDFGNEVATVVFAIAMLSRQMPRALFSVVSLHAGLMGMMTHLGYLTKVYGILWMVVSVPLWLAAITDLVMMVVERRRGPSARSIGAAAAAEDVESSAAVPATQAEPAQLASGDAPATGVSRVLASSGRCSMQDFWSVVQPPAERKGPESRGACCIRGFFYSICVFAVLVTAAVIVFFALTEQQCGVESFFVEELLPDGDAARVLPMEIGTLDTFDSATVPSDIMSLTGVWWISWREDPYPFYSRFHLEELVTFAGTSGNTTGPEWFPARLAIPTGLAFHWGFSNTLVGRAAMMFASRSDPSGPLRVTWTNATHGYIGYRFGGHWYIDYLDEDRWLRTIERNGGEDKWYYELKRIILADGTPHPVYWDQYVRHMGGTKHRAFTTNDWCIRECGLWRFRTCADCEKQCSSR